MKKVYLIPNGITAFGLACGLFVIFKLSVMGVTEQLFSTLQSLAILILLAAVADLADGAIARWIKAESEFGGQFDSLADAVTFGVAPPLLALKSIGNTSFGEENPGTILTFFVIIAAMIYSLCGVLRLVRFNIRSKEAKEEALKGNYATLMAQKKHFTGLPIPAAGAAISSITLISIAPFYEIFSVKIRCIILTIVLIMIGYFMVSRWKFPSVKALHFRVPSFYLVFATGIVAVMILYGILDYFSIVFFALSWLYIVIAWILSFARLIAGRRLKTLQDFEPDEEEDEHK